MLYFIRMLPLISVRIKQYNAFCGLQSVARQISTSYLSLTDQGDLTALAGHGSCPSSQTLFAATRSAELGSGWRSFSTPIGRLPRSHLANIMTPTASARPSPKLDSCKAHRTSQPGWTRPAWYSADQDLAPK